MFIMRLDGNEIVLNKGSTSTIFVKWFRRTYQGKKSKTDKIKGNDRTKVQK